MEEIKDKAPQGLEGVIAATTSITEVDGPAGRLWYSGYTIDELALKATYTEIIYLLWYGELPTREQLGRFEGALAEVIAEGLPEELGKILAFIPRETPPLEVLRSAVSLLAHFDRGMTIKETKVLQSLNSGRDAGEFTLEEKSSPAFRLLAQVPAIVGAWSRLSGGHAPLAPRPEFGLVGNFLYQLRGVEATEVERRTMEMVFVLHADHELNASTFAARITAATLSTVHASVVTALGTLQGPLHGGANEGVIRMLEEIGRTENAENWVIAALARKERIMGFGHRVYRVLDPRANSLQKMLHQLALSRSDTRLYDISLEVERVVEREKKLKANVDFFSASVYHLLGIETSFYTSIFASSRIAGWTAHIREQYAHNRLIRPRALYEGPPERPFVPLSQRNK